MTDGGIILGYDPASGPDTFVWALTRPGYPPAILYPWGIDRLGPDFAAWAFGVDTWDPAWPDEWKRAVVDAALARILDCAPPGAPS